VGAKLKGLDRRLKELSEKEKGALRPFVAALRLDFRFASAFYIRSDART
jgi:hypothetical protein